MPAPADTEEMLKSTTRPARPEDEQTTEEQQQPAQQPEEQQPEQTTNPPAGNKLPAPITPLTRVRGALAAPEDEDQRHADAISNLETQRRQQWEQQMPFAPSGWMPAVRPDEQAAAVRQSDYTAQKQQRQQKNVDLEEQRQVNSQREAQFRATGQSFYRDPYGDLQPVIDTTGRPMYRPTGFETGENEKGETMMVRRNAYGKQEYKTPPITTSGDPADENLYYNLPDGELKPIGKIDDLKGHTNPTIAHAAAREFAHRHAAMWREAINGVESANGEIQGQIAQATADHEAIGTKAEDIQKQIDTLRADPHFNETTGGILGMGGKPSDAALQLQTKANQLQLQLETTQQQQADIAGQIAKGGELDVRAKQAKADLAIYKLKAGHDNAKNLADVRRAILDLQGKTDKNDPVLSEILKKQDEFAKGIQQATDFAKTLGPRGLSSGDAAERPLPGLPDQLQQEPFAMVAKGVKQVGPLSIDRIAQLYGDGKTGFKPSSLLAMNQRIDDIEETIQGFAGQSLAPKSGQMIASLKEEQDYLKNLYANRLTQLPADQQRKVTEYIGSLKTTAIGAVLRDAGVNIVPAMAAAKAGSVGGRIGTAAGGLLGPAGAAIGGIVVGGASAILGYMLADGVQRELIKAAFPDQYDKLVDYAAKDWDQHPIAKTLGGLGGQAPAFGLSAVSTARGMLALGKMAARQEVTAAETAAAKALAIKAGVATAQSVGFDLKENKSVDPTRVLSAVAQIMLLSGEEKTKGPSLGEMRAKAEAGRGGPAAGRQMPEQAIFDEQQRMPAKEANAEPVPKEGENQLGAGGKNPAEDLGARMEAIDKRLRSLKGKNGPAQAHAAAKKAGWSDQEFVDRFEKAFGKKNAPKAPPPDSDFNQQGTAEEPAEAAAPPRTKPFEAEGQPKNAKPPGGAPQADQKAPGFVDVTTGKPMTEKEAMTPPGAEPPAAAPEAAPKPPPAPKPAPAAEAKAAPIVTPPPAEPAAAPKPQKTKMGDKTVDFIGNKHLMLDAEGKGMGKPVSQWQIKDTGSPTGSRTTHDVGEVMDAFSRMSADDFTKQSKADRPNKRGGSEHAKEMGEAAKGNTDLVARLDSHAKLAREASHTAMDAGDMDRALAEGAKAQMFREAHEFATQTGYYSKESIASRAAEAERVAQEKAKANATQTGEKPKGNIGEHQGIPQGTNLPANGGEVRKGPSEQAGGGSGADQRAPEAKAQNPEPVREAVTKKGDGSLDSLMLANAHVMNRLPEGNIVRKNLEVSHKIAAAARTPAEEIVASRVIAEAATKGANELRRLSPKDSAIADELEAERDAAIDRLKANAAKPEGGTKAVLPQEAGKPAKPKLTWSRREITKQRAEVKKWEDMAGKAAGVNPKVAKDAARKGARAREMLVKMMASPATGRPPQVGNAPNGEPDIISDIANEVGHINVTPNERFKAGELEDVKGALSKGAARLLRRQEGGRAVDQAIEDLNATGKYKIGSPAELGALIDKANTNRERMGKAFKTEDYKQKIEQAFLENKGRANKLKSQNPATIDMIGDGGKFKIDGEKFSVVGTDERGDGTYIYIIQDGHRFEVPEGTLVWPDNGKYEKGDAGTGPVPENPSFVSPEEDARIDAELAAKKVAAAEPPGPALELESQTPEQSAAEAKKTREAAAKKAEQDAIAAKAEKPLTGNSENVGQGQMFEADKDLFSGKSQEEVAKEAESKPQKRTSDKVIDALKKAKMMPPGATLGASPFSVAYDGAIDLAIGAIKAGRAVADVVKMAQEHFKAKYPNASAEALEDLANDIKMAHSGVAASGAAAAGRMQKVRDRIANVAFNMGLGEKGKIYDEMAKSRDAADNQANLFGRQNARAIENDIVHAFGQKTDQKAARDALTFAVEAGGDSKALDAMAAKIGASKKAPEKWKQRALDSIAFAQAHMAEMKPMVDRYHRMTRDQVTAENAAGIDTIYRSNYVMHAQDIDNSLGHWFTGEGSRGDFSSFEKNRTHETFADSLAAGVNPKSLDALDLLQSRLMHGQRMINKGAWMEGLKGITDPLTKSPIAAEPTLKERANGSKYFDAPKGYTVEHVGRTAIAVMNGYEGIFHALTDPSRLGDDGFMKIVQQANAGGKSSNLLFDSFHFGRLAAWNAAIRANMGGIMGGGASTPNPLSYKRGLNLLDNTPGEIVKQARLDGRSPEQIKQLIQTKVKLDMLTKEGMNVGQIADNLHQEVLRRLPVIGRFNKFLFDSFQRGIMSEIGTMEFDRQRGMKGNAALTDQEVARKVANEINTRFGNFGRQGQFKSKSAQDVMRLLVLAPQWNEGLLKSEGGAVVNAGKSAANLAMGKGLATSMLTRSVATMVLATFVGNQLLNQYTRGKWTWENPEEGIGAKLSAWIPDVIGKGPGFFLNPMGIGAEVTHLIMSKYEKTDSMRRSVGGFIRSRASAIGRPVATMLFGTNAMGQKIRPENLVKETVKAAVPLPIPAAPLYGSAKQAITGEPGQSFAGQFQKQLMSSGGVKLDQAPSQIQRIQNLATQFNRAHKVEEEGEFYVGHLHDLEHAIEMKQPSEAQSAIEDLLKKSTPKAVVADFLKYAKSPFTRSKKREEEFIKSLNPEQKQTMLAARRSRVQIRDSALNLLRLYFKTHPVAGRQEALDLMSKNR